MKSRAKILVKGVVQGVGFRPFIYGLAKSNSLNGWVLNSTEGVNIEVEGDEGLLNGFIEQIRSKAPPLAIIDSVDVKRLPPLHYKDFIIKHSEGDEGKYVKISPDICTCDDCLSELFNPNDRRYRYPFINCTNCGPRFTIVKDIPYDREKTTMRDFVMCPLCQAEYDDPLNRRFHAQPNACPTCGPSISLETLNGRVDCDDPIAETIKLLETGKIIAIKGLGGFHLACSATDDGAVRELRERKRRTFKPFAVMSASLDRVREYCEINDDEAKLLTSRQRPIVLLKKRFPPLSFRPDPSVKESIGEGLISSLIAPNNNYIGVMLPYTPLHYLLMDSPFLALVMTSANISEEPIVVGNDEAKQRLADLADYFLFHNRDIQMRCDDSVTRVWRGNQIMLRRSRGYAPYPVDLNFNMKEVLACGSELKNTFCLTKDNHAFISHHIGDLQNIEAYRYYQDSIEHYKRLFHIRPEIISYDLHPDYLPTKYALSQKDARLVGVQHHHAHIASCMAENGLNERLIGVACDGAGYGTDGNIWGCEIMLADYGGFERKAHLQYVPLPGGDSATKEVYRMAISYLYSIFGDRFLDMDIPFLKRIDRKRVLLIKQMIERGINSPLTSSCGRLFDAVSSLIGVRDECSYEAQSAIELEMIADPSIAEIYEYSFLSFKGSSLKDGHIIDVSDMFREIIADIHNDTPKPVISAKFHNTVADFISSACMMIRDESKINRIALSGGTFQNIFLHSRVMDKLNKNGFEVYFKRQIPTNDGGLSLGQAIIGSFAK